MFKGVFAGKYAHIQQKKILILGESHYDRDGDSNFTTTKETTEKTTKETTEKTTKETTESTTSRSQKIVYGSRTGNHYHLGGCRYANGAKMTVAEAERKSWEPCAVCNP